MPFHMLKNMLRSPIVFLGYPAKGIANVLNSFGHEQYPYNNVDP
jgi:hypothetical protein